MDNIRYSDKRGDVWPNRVPINGECRAVAWGCLHIQSSVTKLTEYAWTPDGDNQYAIAWMSAHTANMCVHATPTSKCTCHSNRLTCKTGENYEQPRKWTKDHNQPTKINWWGSYLCTLLPPVLSSDKHCEARILPTPTPHRFAIENR